MTVAAERIQLRDPDPKKRAPRMPKDMYAVLSAAALATLPANAPGLTVTEFREALSDRLVKRTGSPQRLIRA